MTGDVTKGNNMPTAIAPLRSLVRVYIGPTTARWLYDDIVGDNDFDTFTYRSVCHQLKTLSEVCFYPTERMHRGVNDCLYALQFTNLDATNPAKWIESHAISPVLIEFVGWYRHPLTPMKHKDTSTGRCVRVIYVTKSGISQMTLEARDFEELEQLRYRVELGSFVGFGE